MSNLGSGYMYNVQGVVTFAMTVTLLSSSVISPSVKLLDRRETNIVFNFQNTILQFTLLYFVTFSI